MWDYCVELENGMIVVRGFLMERFDSVPVLVCNVCRGRCLEHAAHRASATRTSAGAEASTGTSSAAVHAGRTHRGRIIRLRTRTIEQVEFVDDVHHEVGIDGIVPCVLAHHGGDVAADVALLLQDVETLQAHRQGLAFKERL